MAKKTSKTPVTGAARAATSAKAARPTAKRAKVRLLSGGNPQIAKADGDAAVQAYVAAMPGWKRDVGRRLDALITRTIPRVQKAVKWNSPMFGMERDVWFMSWHCFDRYVKVAFFRGARMDPPPPVGSKQKDVRYLHIHEGDVIDAAQFTDWIRQASRLPGEKM